ncbi:hypothetical protein AB0F77_34735 [Streptomyces sp. NPDC026672]|uniref:hypothetical protein n=1 Tax=unclassified Streptomyces TaxID=2593676 RepID=UPI0033F5E3C4
MKAYDDSIRPPWADDEIASAHTAYLAEAELLASAWTDIQGLPPMPAAWFAEPPAEELPPGSGGVHDKAGRVYGRVAQAGEPHAVFVTGCFGSTSTLEVAPLGV